jgi:hypothetical protein
MYSRITVRAVMMKREAAIAQESYCGVSERHKNDCVDECSKPTELTRQCECDENAKRATMAVSVLTATQFSPRVIDV